MKPLTIEGFICGGLTVLSILLVVWVVNVFDLDFSLVDKPVPYILVAVCIGFGAIILFTGPES